ncbi:MAG: ethanolamine ammonia-lyase reactivating factor EutA, partial [Firmicutes bacterium]|nr:ethanolamine ammonia-lyase reactivating factor EutA [Bacillota bacterium]
MGLFCLLFLIPRPKVRARQKKRNDMSLGEKNNKILSVGIDICTTTTSMILSKLAVENTAMVYMAPNVELTSKEI